MGKTCTGDKKIENFLIYINIDSRFQKNMW